MKYFDVSCYAIYKLALKLMTVDYKFKSECQEKPKSQQRGCFQGSANQVDFHIYCSVFHADSRGAIRFSKFDYCSGLRQPKVLTDLILDSHSYELQNFLKFNNQLLQSAFGAVNFKNSYPPTYQTKLHDYFFILQILSRRIK